MSNGFGQRAPTVLRSSGAEYRAKRKRKAREDKPVDKALAWTSFYVTLCSAFIVFTPEVALAALCTLRLC